MKFLSTIVLFLLFASTGIGQTNFTNLVKEYFRVNPFQGSFSTFVNTLSSDSALLKKQLFKKTDTTSYLLMGEYAVFNPFSIDADRVQMVFAEDTYKQYEAVFLNFYVYQITAYFPDTEITRMKIKKEYSNLAKRLKRDLPLIKKSSLKGYENIEDGEVTTYSNTNFALEPAVLSWQTLSKSKQIGLTLIIKIKQINNWAFPVSYFPDDSENSDISFDDF